MKPHTHTHAHICERIVWKLSFLCVLAMHPPIPHCRWLKSDCLAECSPTLPQVRPIYAYPMSMFCHEIIRSKLLRNCHCMWLVVFVKKFLARFNASSGAHKYVRKRLALTAQTLFSIYYYRIRKNVSEIISRIISLI